MSMSPFVRFVFCSLILTCLTSSSLAFGRSKNIENDDNLALFQHVIDIIKQEYINEPNEKEMIEAAINGMLSSLDIHSGYLSKQELTDLHDMIKGGFGGVGFEVTMENGLVKVMSPIDDTPASRSGILPDDYIYMVDDQPIYGMTLSQAVSKMRGKPGTKVKLTIIRDGQTAPLNFNLTREIIAQTSVKGKIIDNNIAYIRVSQFVDKTAKDTEDMIQKLKRESKTPLMGIVLDLRNNNGGLLDAAVELSDLFLNEGEIVSIRGRNPEQEHHYYATKYDITDGLPIIVLINGWSASAPEIVAGALQDNKRAVIMGIKSFGKGSVQNIIPLSDGGAIKLTIARYYTPSGRSIQAEGILPDIEVLPGNVEFPTSKDEVKPLSEAKLPKHLKNNQSNKTTKEGMLEDLIKESKENKLYKSDYQLARAIDLLNGIKYLKKEEKK